MATLAHIAAGLCFVTYLAILAVQQGAIHEVYSGLMLLCTAVFWIGGLVITRLNRLIELQEQRSGVPASLTPHRAESRPSWAGEEDWIREESARR